jgi:hypothetical protein
VDDPRGSQLRRLIVLSLCWCAIPLVPTTSGVSTLP